MLDFSASTPISVPLRFFLTAPLFGLGGALLLLWFGPEVLLTRWHPVTLAVLHCFTAGFMLQVMFGALFQVVPVTSGASIAAPRRIGAVVHALASLGACLLVAGFLLPGRHLAGIGALLLSAATAVLLAATLRPVWRAPGHGSVRPMLLSALFGLGVAVGLGFAAAHWLEHGQPPQFIDWVNLHALWALAGWALPLCAAVALTVMPMFYVTPQPEPQRWPLAAGLLALGLVSVAPGFGAEAPARAAAATLALLTTGFSVQLLRLLGRRRRPRRDATLLGWQLALPLLALGGLLMLLRLALPESEASPALEIAFGLCAVLGGFVNLIAAMLLRILGFLTALHRAGLGLGAAAQIGPPPAVLKALVVAQSLAVAALLGGLQWPPLVRGGAVLMLVAQALLLWTVVAHARALRHPPPPRQH